MNFCSLVYFNFISAVEFVPLLQDGQYMLAAQGGLQNGLSVIFIYWFLKMLLALLLALIDLCTVYSPFHLVKNK